jgi:hypothetical protein
VSPGRTALGRPRSVSHRASSLLDRREARPSGHGACLSPCQSHRQASTVARAHGPSDANCSPFQAQPGCILIASAERSIAIQVEPTISRTVTTTPADTASDRFFTADAYRPQPSLHAGWVDHLGGSFLTVNSAADQLKPGSCGRHQSFKIGSSAGTLTPAIATMGDPRPTELSASAPLVAVLSSRVRRPSTSLPGHPCEPTARPDSPTFKPALPEDRPPTASTPAWDSALGCAGRSSRPSLRTASYVPSPSSSTRRAASRFKARPPSPFEQPAPLSA